MKLPPLTKTKLSGTFPQQALTKTIITVKMNSFLIEMPRLSRSKNPILRVADIQISSKSARREGVPPAHLNFSECFLKCITPGRRL
jgi:hypothetical protein